MAKKVTYVDDNGKVRTVKADKNYRTDAAGGGSFKHSGIGGTLKELKNALSKKK